MERFTDISALIPRNFSEVRRRDAQTGFFAVRVAPILLLLAALCLSIAHAQTDEPQSDEAAGDTGLPSVLLIGDSISMGYDAAVKTALADQAEVRRPPGNHHGTKIILRDFDRLLGSEDWNLIHINSGLHDIFDTDAACNISLNHYRRNMERILNRLTQRADLVLVATTTPVAEDRTKTFESMGPAEVEEVNAIVRRLGRSYVNVHVYELGSFAEQLEQTDGVHFTPRSQEKLGSRVAEEIRKHLPRPDRRPAVAGASDGDEESR